MNTCPAVKADGEVCGARCRGNPRCKTHMNTLEINGPHATAVKELRYVHQAAVRKLTDDREILIEAQADVIQKTRMRQDLVLDVETLRINQRREMETLIREQQDEVRQTGIDPDQRARERRDVLHRQRQEIARQRWLHGLIVGDHVGVINDVNRAQNVAPVQQVERRELAQFANDGQNVHTTVAVQQTKEMVQKLLSIPVAEEYRWNMRTCSKTPGEIIVHCNLTPKGAWQMAAKYCQDENVYGMGAGIYGKVLDGVWQYILKSPDKADLCKILKQEMEDNIGMCAQGNLTRLCNILAGYMEGIGPQESAAEVLGRKLPLLIEIENENERLEAAYNLLVELKVPQRDWIDWVQPLVETNLSLRSNGAGQVIGFAVS